MIMTDKFNDQSNLNVAFSVAMSKKTYDRYDKFDACPYSDDHWFWYKIVGN